jgi:hypothetical protein
MSAIAAKTTANRATAALPTASKINASSWSTLRTETAHTPDNVPRTTPASKLGVNVSRDLPLPVILVPLCPTALTLGVGMDLATRYST